MKLELQQLTAQYGDRVALQAVSATLEGQIIGVLGANASGKTSLLRIVAGAAAPTAGRVLIDGVEVRPAKQGPMVGKSDISYLPQETGFFPFWQRPEETLSGALILRRVPGQDPRALLAAVGLGEEDRSADEFSGGMKQKLRIAQALAHAPRVLILDEPTTGLDIRERFRLLRVFERLRGRVGVIFSTHQPGDAAAVCDRLLILHRGRAVAADAPSAIRAAADGRVFEFSLSSDALPDPSGVDLISAERERGGLRLRAVGNQPEGAAIVPARLEDAYVFLTHAK